MTTFQLDENSNSKRLWKSCHAEGKCNIRRFPNGLRGLKDPEVLTELFPHGIPLVTFDRALPYQHGSFIPDEHPGIIVICTDEDSLETMTVALAMRILRTFKSKCEQWDKLTWTNSICEIANRYACVMTIKSGILGNRNMFDLEQLGAVSNFCNTLDQNARSACSTQSIAAAPVFQSVHFSYVTKPR